MNTKRITGVLQVLSLFFLVDLATHAQAATYSFKSLDPPGATSTYAYSINDRGQVAGYYDDASGSTHGFMYNDGEFTSLDPPEARGTYAESINASGQVAGYYSDVSGLTLGFVYSAGEFTILGHPWHIGPDLEGLGTYARSINASGQVAGIDNSFSNRDGPYTIGFVYSAGQYTPIDIPEAQFIVPQSINASGQVAGYYGDASGSTHGFVYSAGACTFLDPPGGWFTEAYSINASGQVAGYYSDTSGQHGFVYSAGQYTPLDPPGARRTTVYSINDHGQVAGYYDDASGSTHGFVYSAGQYTPIDIPEARSIVPQSINASGQVAGYYGDASGSTHGFIAIPMTPFSAFKVRQLAIDQNRGALFLWSNLTLGGDNNGIDPVKEEVTLKIANATLTIPAESFHKNSHPSLFAFAGQIGNVWIEALIKPLGSNRFAFQTLAYGAPIGDTKNPVTIELTIGDDSGTTTANARTH